MAIRVRGPDGVVNNFPDGTPDATITQAMAAHYGGPGGQAAAAPPAGTPQPAAKPQGNMPWDRVRQHDAERAAESDAAFAAPLSIDPVAEGVKAVHSGADAIRHATGDWFQHRPPENAMAETLSGLGQIVASPVTGALNAFYVNPVSKATGLPKSFVAASLNAVGPGEGAVSVPRSVTALSPVEAKAVTGLVRKGKLDVNAMTGEATRYSGAGIPPTVTDIAGNSGRRIIRANASRVGPGSDAVQTFAQSRALDLPDRIGGQAKSVISSDARTPDQITADLSKARSKQADTDYSAVRGDTIPIHPDAAQALGSQYGLDALGEAAKREVDPQISRGLTLLRDRLSAGGSLGGANMTVGMSDRVSRVLFGKAQAAARTGDADLARTLTILGENVRTPAVAASPGYGAAQANYEAGSKLIDAADTGQDFLKRNTDEFTASTSAMTPEQQEVARAGARRAVERAAGENVGSAPGVARRIADAPEQQQRNAALLGPADATRLQDNMRLEADAVRNAQQVSPQSGSLTANNAMDQALTTGVQAAGAAGKFIGGHPVGGLIDMAKMFLAKQGFSDQEAHALSMLSIDPSKTPEVLSYIAQKAGPQASNGFLLIVRSGTGNAMSIGAPQVAVPTGATLTNAFQTPNALGQQGP